MKNLKFITGLLFFVLAVGFTSCSSDDDDKNTITDSIIGSWKQTNDYGTEITLTFNKNRTGKVNYEYPEDGGGSYEVFEYYYDIEEKELRITGDTQLSGWYDVVITATKLILVDDHDDIEYHFKKI